MRIIDAIIKSDLLFSLKGLAHAVTELNKGSECYPFVKWNVSHIETHSPSHDVQHVMMFPVISFHSEV